VLAGKQGERGAEQNGRRRLGVIEDGLDGVERFGGEGLHAVVKDEGGFLVRGGEGLHEAGVFEPTINGEARDGRMLGGSSEGHARSKGLEDRGLGGGEVFHDDLMIMSGIYRQCAGGAGSEWRMFVLWVLRVEIFFVDLVITVCSVPQAAICGAAPYL